MTKFTQMAAAQPSARDGSGSKSCGGNRRRNRRRFFVLRAPRHVGDQYRRRGRPVRHPGHACPGLPLRLAAGRPCL